MKGKVFAEHKHKLVYPVIAEVKYDEIRLHVKRIKHDLCGADYYGVEFRSYSGKPVFNLEHWAPKFCAFFEAHPEYTELDMGLLVNGNFNDSYRWARSKLGIPGKKVDKKTGKVAPALNVDMVEFLLFDLPDLTDLPFNMRQNDRSDWRQWTAEWLRWDFALPVSEPMFWWAHDEDELHSTFETARKLNYEGLMVKTLDHKYVKGARIDGWLKMKPEAEADGVIKAIIEAISEDGTPLGRAGSVVVELEDGSMATPHGIPHELGRLMWENRSAYLGQWLQFNYMERDRQGGYRHPTFGRLRESK